jgi:tetratricopeptide (TPR) repeat protein
MRSRVLAFLRDESNRALLGWIGGGLVVLATGLWAVFTFYVDHSKPPPPPATTIVEQKGTGIASGRDTNINSPVTIGANVKADRGGVAIGGNASNNTFITGVTPEVLAALTRPWEELSESQKKEIAKLQSDLDLNQRQVRGALEILGEANVPPERLAAKLVDIAQRFKELKTAAAAQPGDDANITALKAEAQKAIQDGELAKADEILAAIEKIQTEALDRLALNAAQTTAQRGDVALTRLRYPDAAQRFAEAAAKVPQGHDDERWKYLNAEADALYRQGDEYGDNGAALSAIERYRHLAELRPRNAFPRDWAATQNNLGTALGVLGERESSTARLEEAVAAHREALQELTRERVPLLWAMAQNNLGIAFATLGERESGTARLDEAVTAFREALQEFTRARAPLDWARTQNNLGLTLANLSERASGTAKLEEAAAAYREALQEFTRARVALDWATTQMNLGIALMVLGERESGTARLDEAVAAFREALQENTRARVPLRWAMSTGNQGVALMWLAERRGDAEMAKLAVRQIEAASRDGGNAPLAAAFEAQLPKARALAQKLAKR